MANEARKIQQAQIKLQKVLEEFVTVMGVEAKRHFVKSFRNQGFEDSAIVKWKPRKGEIMASGMAKVTRKSKSSRYILIKTGDLRRSVRVVSSGFNSVTLGSDLPYAKLHNDGKKTGYVYVRPHQRVFTKKAFVSGAFQGTAVKRRKTKIEIITDRHQVKGHSRRLRYPKRQFIGHSKKLTDLLKEKLNKRIPKAFR